MKDRFEKYLERRQSSSDRVFRLNRRDFLKASRLAAATALATGKMPATSSSRWTLVKPDARKRASGSPTSPTVTCTRKTLNERFVRAILKAVPDDVNAMDPQPDFVFYGGDLAQLGQPAEKDDRRGRAGNMKALKAP